MPIYAYSCSTCGKSFEILQKMSDLSPVHGPDCAQSDCSLQKQMSAVFGIVKSANPFVTKCGKPLAESYATTPVKTPEPAHQCQTGCALHR